MKGRRGQCRRGDPFSATDTGPCHVRWLQSELHGWVEGSLCCRAAERAWVEVSQQLRSCESAMRCISTACGDVGEAWVHS